MKALFSFILFLFSMLLLSAQDFENETEFNPTTYQSSNPTGAELYVKLNDYTGKPLSFYDMALVEHEAKIKIPGITDCKGNVTFRVIKGKTYSINLEDSVNYSGITIPLGYKSSFTKKICFTPPDKYYETRKKTDTIRQNITKRVEIPSSEVMLRISVKDSKNVTLQKMEVRMYCKKYNKLYVATTNSTGDISLLIPANCDFVVGVDELESFTTFNTNKMGGGTMQTVYNYSPVNFKETIKQDTVVQSLPQKPEPTSARVFISVKLADLDKEILVGEPVFFKARNTGKVYKTITDAKGFAYVLVPKGDIYNMSFKYESNVDVLEYPYDNVLRRTRIEYTYIGSKKVEEYYAAIPKKQGFLKEFMSKTIEKIKPFASSVVEKTGYGYNLNFNTGSEISTPLANKKDMLLMTGYYKPEFYSVNAQSGQCNWGVKLAESGISPISCEDDVTLVNTQSCTLYAIDVKNGNMLWSKWLGPVINSTPTVSKGIVYTCYPRNVGYDFKNKDSAFVMVAFNLKSGNIAWQHWLDGEVVGTPIVSGDYVYVITDNESLYQFDKTNGKQMAYKTGGYVSSPTIVNDALYVFKKSGAKDEKCQLQILSAQGLQNKQAGNIQASFPGGFSSFGSYGKMSFNANRMVHFKGKNYCLINGSLYCLSSADNSILWQKSVWDPTKAEVKYNNSLPVVAGGQLIVASPLGKLIFFDALSGKKLNEQYFAGDQLTDAIAYEGWVYCGTTQGKIISYNTKNPNITGWPSWSGGSQHNPVIY